ncbi:DNA polymerase II large subunit, partial [archaeon]|nr:DNA polymerase II large subunit [archaeon]
VAYLTLGLVTAPLEGISDIKIKKNPDGSEYIAVYYSGPIRSAGGTASAMSVLAADFIRLHLGIGPYKPSETEVQRYVTEVEDYYSRVTAKQYHPTKEEIEMIIKNVMIEITGDPTEKLEVSNYKDLERVETNKIRGGMCLVLLDGLPLKAEKMLKRVRKYPKEYKLDSWMWLKKFIKLKQSIHSVSKGDDSESSKYSPNAKYMSKVIAGRPVFSFPGRPGGFRLRYGRSRTGGLASTAFHTAAIQLIEFTAIGTQIATEFPGKATVCTGCDTIEPPVVLLKNGDVLELRTLDDVKNYTREVQEILSLGDDLIPYGEFVSNGHILLPSSYVEEWWAQELERAAKKDIDKYNEYIIPPYKPPMLKLALDISLKYKIPIHPYYNFFYHDITKEDIVKLMNWFVDAKITDEQHILSCEENLESKEKKILETLCVPHKLRDNMVILEGKSLALFHVLGKPDKKNISELVKKAETCDTVMSLLNEISPVIVREKGIIRVGTKMGRPEKAERRLLKGRPQSLFPCGEEGGRMRNIMESYKVGKVDTMVSVYFCPTCKKEVYYPTCFDCKTPTKPQKFCRLCGLKVDTDTHCNYPTVMYKKTIINIKDELDTAMKRLNMREKPILFKGVRAVSSGSKNVEPIDKGLLRTKYDLYVNKDGTTRYDSSDVTLTHFKPKEADVSIEKLKSLGYFKDKDGKELVSDNQVLELKTQDILISDNDDFSSVEYLMRVSMFVDDLLVSFYGLESYYNIKTREDLIGQLVIGLAPHTSAGIIGRIIGFTKAKVCFAHPYWHAGKRRNCDGDEDSFMLLMDSLLNFSRTYLPNTRGGRTMDAPLVLTTKMNPEEVDDESWNVDVVDKYPLQFYEETLEYKYPWDLKAKIEIYADRIGKPSAFHCMYTHETDNINDGPKKTKYVELDLMSEKIAGQLSIADKIRACDAKKVTELVLNKHFLKDIKGNLRTFSRQKLRCISCNEKYRRVPLLGRCIKCHGKLVLTVSEGAVRKYIEPSKQMMDRYNLSLYTRQQFLLIENAVDSLFGKKARQLNLSNFK